MDAIPQRSDYTLTNLIYYFLKLGTTGFGGPVALVSYMHRDLVDKRKWIGEDDYKEGLALAQLAPGPLAAQLAIYIGYVDYKIIGATLAGLAFVLPSFLMVIAIGYAYVEFGGLPWMQSVFYGVGAAVIGIIAISSYKLTKKTINKDWLLWIIFIALAIVTFLIESENIWLILGAGFAVWFVKAPPKFLNPLNSIFFFSDSLTNNRSVFNQSKITADMVVFSESRCICFWKRACDCSFFVWRSGKRSSMVK